MEHYEIRLTGPEAKGRRISGPALSALLHVLSEGTRAALRLRVEGRSKVGGRRPPWLLQAAHFEVTGLREGSTILDVEAPTLAEAVPAKFGQTDLFKEIGADESALSLMTVSLEEAIAGNTESELYDDDLIGTFEGFASVMEGGVESVDMRGPRRVTVDRGGVRRITQLREATPAPRRVRVAGRLDAIRWSDCMFTLMLEGMGKLRGVAVGELGPEDLRTHFGKQVVVSAQAVFQPSGRVLRLEADAMERASGDVSLWAQVPKPLEPELSPRALVEPQGPRTGLNAVFGRWPGDESDEDVARWLREVS